MKQASINPQIQPALEHELPWRPGEIRSRTGREKFQATAVYFMRFIVILALLLAVLSTSANIS